MSIAFSKNKHLRIFTHYSPELHPVFFLFIKKKKKKSINKKKARSASGSKCSFEQKESEGSKWRNRPLSSFPFHSFPGIIFKHLSISWECNGPVV